MTTIYKCGHIVEVTILDDNEMSLSAYLDWKDSVGFNGTKEKCFDCYCKELDAKQENSAKEDFIDFDKLSCLKCNNFVNSVNEKGFCPECEESEK